MTKTCLDCQNTFEVSKQDLAFYEKVSPVINGTKFQLPEPKTCVQCRHQRRLAFRNERKLYNRKCDLCHKEIISTHAPERPFHSYCPTCWWSDNWDSTSVARDIDFNRPFFMQFEELMHEAKLVSLFTKNNENSDYVNQETDDRNCYLNAGGHFNQDCYYNTYSIKGKNNVDNYWVINSELLYMSAHCENCYSSSYLQDCCDVRDSHYCKNCRDCEHCFGCYGLRHKQYYFFNQSLSKEEYELKVAECLHDYHTREEARQRAGQFFTSFPHQAAKLDQCEDCTGDALLKSKNVQNGFSAEECQDCKNIYIAVNLKDVEDVSSAGWTELAYQCCSSMHGYNTLFASQYIDLRDAMYCIQCFQCKNIFGCAGMHHKEYCILNKQYTKEEYEALLPKIIEHMGKTDEWGEYFPYSVSAYYYNDSVAQEYFPIDAEKAKKLGSSWRDNNLYNRYSGPKVDIPLRIQDTPDDILRNILSCEGCEKNYRIIAQELNYYRTNKIPIPHHCMDCRHNYLLSIKPAQNLWSRQCMNCHKNLLSSYAPNRPETIYCEACYLKTAY